MDEEPVRLNKFIADCGVCSRRQADALIEGGKVTVDGETADESIQQWWCITKGGEMLMTGVDDTMIADGEAYEFTLTTGW